MVVQDKKTKEAPLKRKKARSPVVPQTEELVVKSVEGNGDGKQHDESVAKPINQRTLKGWLYVGAGAVLLVLGMILLITGNAGQNALLITIGALISVGGGFVGYRGWTNSDIQISGGKVAVKNCNTLIIDRDNIKFEHDASEMSGNPQKCRNDGKYYYVLMKGLNGDGGKISLVLPDLDPSERHYDPMEAINCLRMELVKRYLNYQPSTSQIVSMITIGVITGLELIALIALGG